VRWEALIPADGSPPPEWKEGKMDEVEQPMSWDDASFPAPPAYMTKN